MRRIFGVVATAVVLLGGAACGDDDRTGIAEARSIIRDADRFSDSLNAAQAFLDASEAFLDEAKTCEAEKSRTDPACIARYSYAAWLQAQSVTFTQCTLPGILESRKIVEARFDEFLAGGTPDLPPAPDC